MRARPWIGAVGVAVFVGVAGVGMSALLRTPAHPGSGTSSFGGDDPARASVAAPTSPSLDAAAHDDAGPGSGWYAALAADAEPDDAGTAPATVLPTPQDWERYNAPYDGRYHFMRIRYSASRRGRYGVRGRGPPWAHDYPRGERNFARLLDAMTYVHPLVDGSNIYPFDDPHIFENPIAYLIEVSAWEPTDAEVEGLREYLLKGGFLIVDDFRGQYALDNLEFQMNRVLPGVQFVQLDETHEIFDSFFRIDPHKVIPPYGPQDPKWYGIFEDNDRENRLMAIINYDNDISEYWEFSDRGWYPVDLANEAYKLGVNYIIYGMTH